MSAAIIGSPVNITFNAGTASGTLTPGSGASHLAALVTYPDFNGTLNATAGVSVGGVNLTRLVFVRNATNNEANAEIWYLATPSSSAGQTVAVTFDGTATWKDVGITFISMSGTGTPVTTNTDQHNGGTNLNAAVTAAVGDIVVSSASSDRSGSAFGSWANSFTSDLESASANSLGRYATAHKIAASTTETANIQGAGGSASFSVALAVAVFPDSGGGSTPASRLTLLGVG